MQQISPALVNELHLSPRLNGAVQNQRRGEFALLLSLLSAQVQDMAQFNTPRYVENSILSNKFDLPLKQALICETSKTRHPHNHSEAFQQGGLLFYRLKNTLQQEAIVTRHSLPAGLSEVLENSDLRAQVRYRAQNKSTTANPYAATTANLGSNKPNSTFEVTALADNLVYQRQMSTIQAQA